MSKWMMYVNDIFLGIALYSWWFYNDSTAGWIACGNFAILAIGFVMRVTPPSDKQ